MTDEGALDPSVVIDALTELQPVLTNLAATGDDFAKSFNVFLTYPFVDEVVGRDPEVAGARGMNYERLDQLALEHILGAR